ATGQSICLMIIQSVAVIADALWLSSFDGGKKLVRLSMDSQHGHALLGLAATGQSICLMIIQSVAVIADALWLSSFDGGKKLV
ncbi:hypothetical protein QWT36_23720, partial [Salmonella enterica subsp. enterica serovar Typhi]|nr:hypothetical protein [Salmonella enterica subsp. enterica serovar Typhi]